MYISIWSNDGQARAILVGSAEGGDPGQRSVGPGQRSGAKRSVLLNRLQASETCTDSTRGTIITSSGKPTTAVDHYG